MQIPAQYLMYVYISSAGIGRTGTFLALDYLLDQLETEGMVDVLSYTTLMRTNRVDMIQTLVSMTVSSRELLSISNQVSHSCVSNVFSGYHKRYQLHITGSLFGESSVDCWDPAEMIFDAISLSQKYI